jgi:signal transduction histidine kinase
MNGSPSVATFGFKTAERINIGQPIILDGRTAYSLFVVTPTAVIYAEMDKVLAAQRTETFLLLGGISAAISLSIFFLVRWNSTLSKAVQSRTHELEDANKSLQAHDKLQKEFINVAAHELRTPVQPLLGVAELIESYFDSNDKAEITREELALIVRNAKRLERLSSDLLDASRIETQSLSLNKEIINLNEKINNVINDTKSFIRRGQNLQIIFEAKTNESLMVEADKMRLFEVISNLLKNAIKFTAEGTIHVTLDQKDGEAIVTISDTGSGIDREIFPRLFEKFTSKSEQGTGLGLYLSKGIIEAHNGKIWAQNNEDGKGATFSFTLPTAGAPEKKEAITRRLQGTGS